MCTPTELHNKRRTFLIEMRHILQGIFYDTSRLPDLARTNDKIEVAKVQEMLGGQISKLRRLVKPSRLLLSPSYPVKIPLPGGAVEKCSIVDAALETSIRLSKAEPSELKELPTKEFEKLARDSLREVDSAITRWDREFTLQDR